MTLTSSQIFQELKSSHLFSALTDLQLEQLIAAVELKSLPSGKMLFSEGDRASHFYLVRSGKLKLFRISANGGEKVIEIIGPGNTFAEAIMFSEIAKYPVNAQTLSAVEIYAIGNDAFLKMLENSPDSCFRVMSTMSKRLHKQLAEIDALTLQNASLRVIQYLISLVEEGHDNKNITLPANKNVVASRLSVQPETFSRILSHLSQQGMINVDGLQISIASVERFKELARNGVIP